MPMKTYLLPGYSDKNKSWIDEIVEKMTSDISISGIYWKHWDGSQTVDGWIEEEAQRIINNSNTEKINIVAKSIGTMVCMAILKLRPEMVNKIILCGIPFKDFLSNDERRYELLKDFSVDSILCIQNEQDSYGSFIKAESFVHAINPNIKIISKPRDDHYYPYPDEFVKFLK